MFETQKVPTHANKTFVILIALSAFIHAIALLQINWNSEKIIRKDELIEVDLFTIEIPPPPKILKKPTQNYESVVKKTTVSKAGDKSNTPKEKKTDTKDNAEVLVVKKISKPVIKKPTLSVESQLSDYGKEGETDTDVKLSEKRLNIPRVKSKQASSLDSPQIEKQKTPIKGIVKSSKKTVDSPKLHNVKVDKLVKTDITGEAESQDLFTEVNDSGGSPTKSSTSGVGEKKDESGRQQGLKIEGEISSRKVIYKPIAPQLNLDRDVTVILKFTVLPNGEVDQVFPYQKADPELERIAIEMLHQYRFEPLFGSTAIQSGIIHFTVYRKK